MKKVIFAEVILFVLAALYLILPNSDIKLTLKLLDYSAKSFTTANTLGLFSTMIFICGVMAGAGIVYIFLSLQREKTKAYKRELEKTSVLGADNASKVDVLEAKIKTLEKAFNTVIDERKQMEIQIETLNTQLEKINKQN